MLEQTSLVTIDEIYRERLKLLIDQYGSGSQAKFAKLIGRSPALVSQWRIGAVDAATGKTRKMGVETARDIEEKLNLPRGWFDQPLESTLTKSCELSGKSDFNTLKSNVSSGKEMHTKAMPLLDLEGGVDFAISPQEYFQKNNVRGYKRILTELNNRFTFAITMTYDITKEIIGENIAKNDILVIEPNMEPRHGDLVLVGINYQSANRRGLIARCELGLDNSYSIKYNDMYPISLPSGSLICGVVVEIRRRIVTIDDFDDRVNNSWNILETLVD